jgi:hypothetical protein
MTYPLAFLTAFAVVGMVLAWRLSGRVDVQVHDSCGCVFCDLDLVPVENSAGELVHELNRGGAVPCDRKG